MRSRHAVTAFLISLFGASVNFIHGLTPELPASLQGPATMIMPIIIITAVLAQWFYARGQKAAGVLS